MPNDCVNHLTITSTSETDLKEIMESDMSIVIDKRGKNGIRFHYTSSWEPDYSWLESVSKKYPSCWIKNEWISEEGKAGVWIGCKNNIKWMEWDDLSIEDEYYMFTL